MFGDRSAEEVDEFIMKVMYSTKERTTKAVPTRICLYNVNILFALMDKGTVFGVNLVYLSHFNMFISADNKDTIMINTKVPQNLLSHGQEY